MAESPGTIGSMWQWLRCALYSRDLFGTLGRVTRMAATGNFGAIAQKVRNLQTANGALAVYGRPASIVRTGPPLHLAGNIHGHGGYDHLVLKTLIGLTDGGVHVFRDKRAFMDAAFMPPEYAPSERMYDWVGPRLAVVPPHCLRHFRATAATAAWTMWETDRLPDGSVEHLNACGLLLIPSAWGVECFRANGVTVPMEVVPLGYDPDVFAPRAAGTGPAVCTFGTAGALDAGGLRKNVQRVIDLFRLAFPGRTDVRLKVKITPRSPMVDTYGDSRVEVINTGLAPAALADWYKSLTCYVNASYGEGFGLHLLEAMGCGVPLISTTFSAVGEVFDSSVGYEVGYKLIEAKNKVYSGLWADPDNEQLVARMQQVFADRAEAERFGALSAARAPAFSWAESIRKLTAALAKYGYLPPEFGPK